VSVCSHRMLDWLYNGVDFSIAGNGGPECVAYISPIHRMWETAIVVICSVVEILIAVKYIRKNISQKETDDSLYHSVPTLGSNGTIKQNYIVTKPSVLLVALSLVFGVEIGYKFATKQIIYILNPCHVLTATMVSVLFLNFQFPNVDFLHFRVQLNLLSGALLAILLPVVNTRFLSCETESYWLHHCLLYLVPVYLISLGGSYSCEPIRDCWWPVLSIGVGFLYHFTFLQCLALATQVNLNNMLCPAVSDPFRGSFYRMWAFLHQHILIAVHGKLYCILSHTIISLCR
uniref:Transmembrane protein 164 n=1 Tax=Ciona savignyi TaxID=51511 RepID=H2ZA31_CIOSA